MIVLWRRGAIVIAVLLVFTSCRSQNETLTTESRAPETVISSVPPFKTKEPDRYRAVRTITTVNASGETLVTKSSVARDGELRRQQSTVGSKAVVYLDVPEGRFVLLPDEKVYADLADESTISADQGEDGLEASPDALVNTEKGSSSYQKMGSEVIAGRSANKYRIVVNSSAAANVSQSETMMWIDEILQMPVRSETKSADGTRVTMELSEIELDVARKLFAVPEGYQKIKFSELRKRLSKS
jgi:hypothetical protein